MTSPSSSHPDSCLVKHNKRDTSKEAVAQRGRPLVGTKVRDSGDCRLNQVCISATKLTVTLQGVRSVRRTLHNMVKNDANMQHKNSCGFTEFRASHMLRSFSMGTFRWLCVNCSVTCVPCYCSTGFSPNGYSGNHKWTLENTHTIKQSKRYQRS